MDVVILFQVLLFKQTKGISWNSILLLNKHLLYCSTYTIEKYGNGSFTTTLKQITVKYYFEGSEPRNQFGCFIRGKGVLVVRRFYFIYRRFIIHTSPEKNLI